MAKPKDYLKFQDVSKDQKSRLGMLFNKDQITYSYENGEFVTFFTDAKRTNSNYKITLDDATLKSRLQHSLRKVSPVKSKSAIRLQSPNTPSTTNKSINQRYAISLTKNNMISEADMNYKLNKLSKQQIQNPYSTPMPMPLHSQLETMPSHKLKAKLHNKRLRMLFK